MNASGKIEAENGPAMTAPRSDSMSRPYKFHHTVTGAWDAMLDACRSAERSIELEEFILLPGNIGDRFMNVLATKADAGVRVRLLLDWWGCRELMKSDKVENLRKHGVEVSFYRPPSAKTFAPLKFFPRNHRKVLIVDGERSFAGGVCILDKISDWRDSMVEYDHEVTGQLSRLFETTWNFTTKGTPVEAGGVDFTDRHAYAVIANAPHTNNVDFTKVFIEKLENAHTRVRLVTPYFAPVADVLEPLYALLDRGVSLEIILSDYSKYAPYVVGKRLAGALIERGAKIYYYEPSMLHLKQVVIDDSWCAIGSFNLDGLSMRQNEEVMVTTGDSNFIAELQEQFERDLMHSRAFTMRNWKNRPLSEKLTGALLVPFRKYL
ncbi:phospholipase D-like domain-containing protein [Kordiimonas gwangyangensis]|uniref:phospholipase D-like domain-containing protein n=1 Tax=Kordiimonas gwangyangensis TaxID=288022 RepID=UPI00036E69E6|nr:phospholipase D-like domain-containing protein [Kordiimonas gwangyangensis]